MSVTVFSFVMSVLFSTAFIFAIHLLRNSRFFLQTFGIHSVLFLYGLSLFRMLFVVEMPRVVPIKARCIYNDLCRFAEENMLVDANGIQISWPAALCIIWLGVAIYQMGRFVWHNLAMKQSFSYYFLCKDATVTQVMEQVKQEAWRTPQIQIYTCPKLETPMGVGLFHKRICLPDQNYTKEELYYILKHEYTHFCSGDLLIKFLVRMLCCVFWWNPAVYLLKKDVSQILEMKCDAKATKSFSKEERLAYLSTIVRILKDNVPAKKASRTLATQFIYREKKDDLLERFEVITSAIKPAGRLCQAAFLGLSVFIVMLSYTFIFQPAFDPPREDIYTDGMVQEVDTTDAYILEKKDGTYSLVLADGTEYLLHRVGFQIYTETEHPLQIKEDS